jgi:hypothetical protein
VTAYLHRRAAAPVELVVELHEGGDFRPLDREAVLDGERPAVDALDDADDLPGAPLDVRRQRPVLARAAGGALLLPGGNGSEVCVCVCVCVCDRGRREREKGGEGKRRRCVSMGGRRGGGGREAETSIISLSLSLSSPPACVRWGGGARVAATQ